MIHFLWLSLLVPIIVHLVHRRKAKPMPFSTLYFLRRVDQRVARRQRLREWLLLAVRLLLLAALVGALERPMWRTSNFRGTSVPTTAAIVLDNSFSMQATAQGATAFARGQAAALQVLDGLKAEDAAVLEMFDAPLGETAPPSTALADLRARVSRMACGDGSGDVTAALRRAREGLNRATTRARELYLVTDLQRAAWPDGLRDALADFPSDVPVYLVDAGADVAGNLAVADLDFGFKVNVAGAPAVIHCRVSGTGSASAQGKLSLVVNGEKVAEQDVALAPGGVQEVIFRHIFPQAGDFSGWVELTPDALPADNRRSFTVKVLEQLPILLVNGQPSILPHRDGAFFLRLALLCGAQSSEKLPLRVDVVPVAEFSNQRLEEYACIVLADVPRIDADWPDRLGDYVRRGGGLLVFCGESMDPAAWNAALGAGAAGLLPANLQQLQSAPDAEKFFRVQRADDSHPIFRDIAGELDLSSTQVTRLFAVDAKEQGVLMQTDAGPLFMERRVGNGSVVLCTSSGTPAWNNMPLKPWFLPVMHQIVYYMSRTAGEEHSTPVGMARVIELRGTDKPVEVGVYAPDTDQPAPRLAIKSALNAGANRAVFRATERPGIYRAEYAVADAPIRQWFAVNVSPSESDLSRYTLAEASEKLGLRNVVPVARPEKIAEVVRTEREGLPLWDYLLAATLLLAVLETFVGNVFVKH